MTEPWRPSAMAGLRRHATTLVLCALALGALAVMMTVDRGAVSTNEALLRKKNLFEAWRLDDITEVSIATPGRTSRLSRAPANDAGQRFWDLAIDGASYPAEEQKVDQYLGTLEFATADRRVSPESVDRAAFKLDAPRLRVTVAMGAQRCDLALGGPAPTPPGALYAEVAGRGVFVVSAELGAALDAPAEGLRSRSFVPYVSTEVSALSLDGQGGARHFARAPWSESRAGAMRFDGSTAEGSVRVSAGAMDTLWSALGRMEAEAFLSDADADKALAKEVTLTLVPTDPAKKRAVIDLGGDCPGKADDVVAVRREPSRTSVCVPRSTLEALELPASSFVDRHLFGAPLDEVTEVKLSAGDRAVDLARSASAWHERQPVDRNVEAELGKALVDGLLDLEATRLEATPPDLKALGLDPPASTARIVSLLSASDREKGPEGGSGRERIEELAVGTERDGFVRVRRAEDGTVAVISAESARVLRPSDLALRSRKIFDTALKDVRSLRVEGTDQGVQRFERTDTGGFRLVEPKGEGLVADIGLTSDLAEALGGLTAERWVADKDDGSYGLDKPRLVIEAEVGDGGDAGATRTLKVAIGAPAIEGAFAREGDDPAVLVVPRTLEAAADRWLLDRAALSMEPGNVKRVTLTAPGGKKLTVEQAGGAFRVVGGPGDAASLATAAGVRDGLDDLVAEGVASVGKAERREGLDKPALRLEVEWAGSGDPAKPPVRIAIGAGDAFHGVSVYYARREGIDATYVVAQSKVRPFLDALGVK